MIDKKVKKTQIEQSKIKEKYFNHEKLVTCIHFSCTCEPTWSLGAFKVYKTYLNHKSSESHSLDSKYA